MKTLFSIPPLFLILLSSCVQEGPVGPQGSPGLQGPAGADGENGYVFEYENVNFTAPNYSVLLEYPNDFDGLYSDVALVYFLYGTDEVDGEVVDIWKQLPNTEFTPDGILEYDFDFTKNDVNLFLEAEFPLDWLTANYTDSWIVRVVVVPGDFWNSGRVDVSDYYAVKNALGLPDINKERRNYPSPK